MKRWSLFLPLFLCLASTELYAERIALVSDLNGRYGSTDYSPRVRTAIESLIGLRPELVISTGDMVAGQRNPLLSKPEIQGMWQAFHPVVSDPLARAGIPFAVTPGNHDASGYNRFVLEREQFELEWQARTQGLELLPGSEWPWRYATKKGSVLLVAFYGTRTGRLADTERAFVERMLRQEAEATVTIVISHLPMWPLARGREREILDDPRLLALLHDHGVDIYASGHHHVYFAGTDSAGMVHLSVGALGGNGRAFSGEVQRQPHSFALVQILDGRLEFRSRVAPGFNGPVDPGGMPVSVKGPLGTLRRIEGPVALRR